MHKSRAHRGCCLGRRPLTNVVSLLIALFFQKYSPIPNTSATATATTRQFVSSASSSSIANQGIQEFRHTSTTETILSRDCDVYIVLTPFENTIGRATAEELAKQLLDSTLASQDGQINPRTTSIICLVRCPSLVSTSTEESFKNVKMGISYNPISFISKLVQGSREVRKNWIRYMKHWSSEKCEKENNLWLDRFSRGSPVLVLSSFGNAENATDFSFDPFGDTHSIRKSAENCLSQIRMELLRCMTSSFLSSENPSAPADINTHSQQANDDDCDIISATMRIRGILFNPYGCPPTTASEKIDYCSDDGQASPPRHQSRLSPLSAYKLLSVAIFVDAALSMRTTRLNLSIREFSSDGKWRFSDAIALYNNTMPHATGKITLDKSSSQLPLRIIVVGTEAARGLPKMGIPVPDFRGATESTIRNKLLLDATDSNNEAFCSDSRDWEIKYAEMNALLVLYLKAMGGKLKSAATTTHSSNPEGDIYLGIVSPGMTPESFNIAHVPESGRTLAFRSKLWLCRGGLIFDWLQKCEIAKTTEDAGSLLTRALLNRSVGTDFCDGLRWDDIYPSGSFVGAQSGTGHSLCEQSLLLYNATSNKVSLFADFENDDFDRNQNAENDSNAPTIIDNSDRMNFLNDHQLQSLVHRVVREIIDDSNR